MESVALRFFRSFFAPVALLFIVAVYVVVALVSSAHAAETYFGNSTVGNAVVHLYDQPCEVDELIEQVGPFGGALLKGGMIEWQGEQLPGCWMNHPDGTPYIFEEDGTGGALIEPFFVRGTGV
jgi:hypothetical protein